METIKRWQKERRLFVISISIIAAIFYLSLPLSLAFIPDTMNKPAIFGVTWAWIYAFCQVFMTWIFGYIYWVKAKQLDKMIDRIKQGETE